MTRILCRRNREVLQFFCGCLCRRLYGLKNQAVRTTTNVSWGFFFIIFVSFFRNNPSRMHFRIMGFISSCRAILSDWSNEWEGGNCRCVECLIWWRYVRRERPCTATIPSVRPWTINLPWIPVLIIIYRNIIIMEIRQDLTRPWGMTLTLSHCWGRNRWRWQLALTSKSIKQSIERLYSSRSLFVFFQLSNLLMGGICVFGYFSLIFVCFIFFFGAVKSELLCAINRPWLKRYVPTNNRIMCRCCRGRSRSFESSWRLIKMPMRLRHTESASARN